MSVFWFCVIVLIYKVVAGLWLRFCRELGESSPFVSGTLLVASAEALSFVFPFIMIPFLELMIYPLLPFEMVVGYWDVYWIGWVWAFINAKISIK